MAKKISVEKALFKGLDNIYKFCKTLSESPSTIKVEGRFLTLTYSGKEGLIELCISCGKDNVPYNWIDCAECFDIDLDTLTAIHKAKKCDEDSIYMKDTVLHFKAGNVAYKIPTWNCKNSYDPITNLVDAIEDWCPIDVNGKFKKVGDFARVNLNTGEVYAAGSSKIEEKNKANVLLVGRKLIPKCADNCGIYVTLEPVDKNFGIPYLLFNSDDVAGILKYPKILINW